MCSIIAACIWMTRVFHMQKYDKQTPSLEHTICMFSIGHHVNLCFFSCIMGSELVGVFIALAPLEYILLCLLSYNERYLTRFARELFFYKDIF